MLGRSLRFGHPQSLEFCSFICLSSGSCLGQLHLFQPFTKNPGDSTKLPNTLCRPAALKLLADTFILATFPYYSFLFALHSRPSMYLPVRQDTTAQEQNPFRLYHYDPTIAGAVVMLLLFLGTTILHFWQLFRARCWFVLPLAIGGICKRFSDLPPRSGGTHRRRLADKHIFIGTTVEFMGYAARCKSGSESPDWTLGPYIIQAILLLAAPSLFAATIYMQLGRVIMLLHGESRALIRKQWLTKIFVTGDVLSFVLQGGGTGPDSRLGQGQGDSC